MTTTTTIRHGIDSFGHLCRLVKEIHTDKSNAVIAVLFYIEVSASATASLPIWEQYAPMGITDNKGYATAVFNRVID